MNTTFFIFLAFFCVIYLAIIALMVVSMWRIFRKMGAPGWACLIPVYSSWVMIERLRKPRSWFWIILVTMLIYMALYTVFLLRTIGIDGVTTPDMVATLLIWIAAAVVMLVYSIKITHALSKAFGQGVGFTVGMIFLPVIFMPILAFGAYQFVPEGEKTIEKQPPGDIAVEETPAEISE